MTYQEDSVVEFNTMMHKNDPTLPTQDIDRETVTKRIKIMVEEMNELVEAMENNSPLHDIAKEMADVEYVLWGTISAYGLMGMFKEIYEEVHRSNMTKTYVEGEAKPKKGEGYKVADILSILEG